MGDLFAGHSIGVTKNLQSRTAEKQMKVWKARPLTLLGQCLGSHMMRGLQKTSLLVKNYPAAVKKDNRTYERSRDGEIPGGGTITKDHCEKQGGY